jgi:DNA-binding beta-propeller fold protein YncE
MKLGSSALAFPFIVIAISACTGTSSPPGRSPEEGCVPTATLTSAASTGNLQNRAYVASRDSGNITVIDLDSLEIVASLDTCGPGFHMMELNGDFTKGYASDTETGRIDVFDVRTMKVTKEIVVGEEPTHLSLSRDGRLLGVVSELEDAVSFVDPERDVEVKRVEGFHLPHFVRFTPDGEYAYVANLRAHHVTRVDLSTLEIDGEVPLDGFESGYAPTLDEEGGFADAQIDGDGVLWAAHRETGQTLVYDTKAHVKLPQRFAGSHPWVVFAEHPFQEITARAVPVWGSRSVALFDAKSQGTDSVDTEETESYGVNYSPLVPERAFVMNRLREEVAVVNTRTMVRETTIPVGGATETASTTADGRWIVAAVSTANSVVVIDAVTKEIVKTFDNVGSYPWTVTIPLGQNYCH